MVIANSTFNDNEAYDYGGALYNDAGVVTISGSTFYGNEADDSGVIEIYGGSVTITGSTFYNNYADDDAGVSYIYSNATVNISSSAFFNNYADYWGGGVPCNRPWCHVEYHQQYLL